MQSVGKVHRSRSRKVEETSSRLVPCESTSQRRARPADGLRPRRRTAPGLGCPGLSVQSAQHRHAERRAHEHHDLLRPARRAGASTVRPARAVGQRLESRAPIRRLASSFDHDLQIEGHDLKAGEYSLWLIPQEHRPWTVIFHRAAHVFHRPYPGEADEALRVDVTTESASHVETLAIEFPRRVARRGGDAVSLGNRRRSDPDQGTVQTRLKPCHERRWPIGARRTGSRALTCASAFIDAP